MGACTSSYLARPSVFASLEDRLTTTQLFFRATDRGQSSAEPCSLPPRRVIGFPPHRTCRLARRARDLCHTSATGAENSASLRAANAGDHLATYAVAGAAGFHDLVWILGTSVSAPKAAVRHRGPRTASDPDPCTGSRRWKPRRLERPDLQVWVSAEPSLDDQVRRTLGACVVTAASRRARRIHTLSHRTPDAVPG